MLLALQYLSLCPTIEWSFNIFFYEILMPSFRTQTTTPTTQTMRWSQYLDFFSKQTHKTIKQTKHRRVNNLQLNVEQKLCISLILAHLNVLFFLSFRSVYVSSPMHAVHGKNSLGTDWGKCTLKAWQNLAIYLILCKHLLIFSM